MRFSLSIITALLASAAAFAQTTFSNPVIGPNWADPTVWQADGHFYTLATGLQDLKTSEDLVHWEIVGDPKERPISEQTREVLSKLGKWIWAPDMLRAEDRWMLYVACYNSLEDNRIACLSSDSPTGPWTYEGIITDSKDNGIKDTIDAEVVRDPKTGKMWLFFGSTGRVHRIQLDATGTSIAPGAGFEHVAGLDRDVNRQRDKVFEGTYIHRHKGWWYLFASVGDYRNDSYRVVCGRSRKLTGTFRNKEGLPLTEGNWTTVISSGKDDRFYGPGHNGEIFTDSKGQDYIIYHSHDRALEKASWRPAMLQRIFWDRDGWPYVDGGKPAQSEITPIF